MHVVYANYWKDLTSKELDALSEIERFKQRKLFLSAISFLVAKHIRVNF